MPLQQPIEDMIPTANADVPEHGIDLFALAIALISEWRVMQVARLLL